LNQFGVSNDSSTSILGQIFEILDNAANKISETDNNEDKKTDNYTLLFNNTNKATTPVSNADPKNYSSCRFYLAVNDKFAEVTKVNGKCYINGNEVSSDAFANAIKVIESNGDSNNIINSINDIEREYRLEATKNQTRINEIEEQLNRLQNELASLRNGK